MGSHKMVQNFPKVVNSLFTELDGDNENFHRFSKALEKHGLNPKKQLIITDCLQDLHNPFWGQAFISSKNELYLCGNTVWKSFITSDRKKLQQILIHNLVHLYDKEVLNFDLYTTEDLACSKIRAYNFSNECRGDRRCILENTKADMKVSIATEKMNSEQKDALLSSIFAKCINDKRPTL